MERTAKIWHFMLNINYIVRTATYLLFVIIFSRKISWVLIIIDKFKYETLVHSR